ncbi:hypothetical protein GCM10018791_08290 [Streptomyces zaomyceticus]|nr:hypothetical protein GCM10018791_08290 [Streptomyces zaomyceticus]
MRVDPEHVVKARQVQEPPQEEEDQGQYGAYDEHDDRGPPAPDPRGFRRSLPRLFFRVYSHGALVPRERVVSPHPSRSVTGGDRRDA